MLHWVTTGVLATMSDRTVVLGLQAIGHLCSKVRSSGDANRSSAHVQTDQQSEAMLEGM